MSYVKKSLIARSTLICAICCGLGGAAIAAESQASSMAGGMPESGATVNATTMAGESGSNQSSGQSSSLSTTDRSTSASAYDSSLTGAGPGVAVKNIATERAALKNPQAPAKGYQPAGPDGLIQSNVRQNPADFVDSKSSPANAPTTGSTSSVQLNSTSNSNNVTNAPPATVKPRVIHNKVQYWNQRRGSATR